MMVQDMILVCAGTESVRARESGLRLLQFGLRLQADGSVYRALLSGKQEYLGVMDQGMKRFCTDLWTADSRGAAYRCLCYIP